MSASLPVTNDLAPRTQADFSFVLGGPLFQLFHRLHLAGDRLELPRRRILASAALAWLPLLVLSAVQGLAFGTRVPVPFLLDIDAHVRFLIVVPLLIAAELVVHQRIRFVARQFVERELIPPGERPRFDAAIASTVRLRNSVVAEVALLAFVYLVGVNVIWRGYTALDTSTWYAPRGSDGATLSLAGMWYAFVSVPLFQFLLLRWYYRIFIWARFLWQVSRLDLRLVPTHPDRLGGLGFLSMTSSAFAPLAAAHGALVSGWIATRIFHHGAALLDFKVEIVAVAVVMLCLVFTPFLVFSRHLAHFWRQGERDYGPLAERYAHQFEAKWVTGSPPPREALLGTNDIQSLSDMAHVYDVAHTMRFVPFTKQGAIQVLVATLAPIAPLVLTMMPLAELVKRLAKIVL
jgi:hypothetical protein